MITGGSYIYGAEEISLKVIRYLSSRYETHCAINGWNDGNFISRLQEMQVPYSDIKLGWIYITKPRWTLDSLWHAPRAYWQYARLIRKFKPSVVYHSSFRSVFLLFPFLNNRNVLHVHDRLTDARTIRFMQRIDKKINRYIAISEFIKRDLLSIGIPDSKIKLIYNGIDFAQSIVPEFPFTVNKCFHIGIVGQLLPRKGHQLLLNALAVVKNTRPDFYLHIFGKGDVAYQSTLQVDVENLGLKENVIWHGYVEDKASMYGAVDFCVVPAIEPEPFGLTAIEPAVFGRPVLAASIGALPEIVSNGITGILFRAGDVESLKEGLLKMMHDVDYLKQLGQQALDLYRKRFSEISMNEQIEIMLQDISDSN
jgi:glycosyltransferase involved in cell wall biosynthesis